MIYYPIPAYLLTKDTPKDNLSQLTNLLHKYVLIWRARTGFLLLMSRHKSQRPKRVRPSDNHKIIFSQGTLLVCCCSFRLVCVSVWEGDRVEFQEVTESLYNYSLRQEQHPLEDAPESWNNMRDFCEQNTVSKQDE